ncbi:MAG TPA: 3-hydroxyacyl-[acyl-carrier-protein] dehydratase FabZ [Candidatus Kryptonia bacterium]|nr:3-hydroxyacyl-[acyl-carrier-protein] dehydratase FabZ [Candidatus Kryptonia bacterium]
MRNPEAFERSAVDLLPHRYPFLLLDRVLMVEPGRWAAAVKNITRDEPLVDANGQLPAVLLAEVMAQTAGLAAATPTAGEPAPAMLVKLDRFRCRRVAAGDQLLAVARVLRRFGASVSVRARLSVAGRPRAAAELVLHCAALGPPRLLREDQGEGT